MALPPVAGNPQRTPMAVPPAGGDDDILDRMRAARQGFAQQLMELSTQRKPNYELNGQTVSWQEYGTYLRKQIAELNLSINAMDPYEVITQGYT